MAHLIDKDALVAEIEKRIELLNNKKDEVSDSMQVIAILLCIAECTLILSFIDTLEVEEIKEPADVLIEKACKLLERMIWEVTYEDLEGNSVQHCDKMEFIENFRKYMKGE